ncbi:MAG: hypothetical protein JO148_12260 [Acidimicrobiia bacterium]|nr:hypothetical protein [Acidimicrobiia bacterium]
MNTRATCWSRTRRRRAAWLAVALGAVACAYAAASVPARATDPAATPVALVGAFSIAPGSCRASGAPSGSYVEVDAGTSAIPNPASPCDALERVGVAYTPLSPGTQGLITGRYQLDPVPTFDTAGNSMAGAIVAPVRFLATNLGLSTTCADEEAAPTPTGVCAAPTATHAPASLWGEPPGAGGCPSSAQRFCLYGDLSGLTMTWAGLPLRIGSPTAAAEVSSCVSRTGCYDQGVAVGPDLGSTTCSPASPPHACSLSGSIDPATGAYSLDIRAAVDTGLLAGMTVHYALTGTFTPAAGGGIHAPVTVPSLGASPPPASTPSPSPTPSSPSPAGASPPPSANASPPSPSNPRPSGNGVQRLVGTFVLGPPTCAGDRPAGSWFVVSYGTKVQQNPASSCAGGAATLLAPGAVGLPTGHFLLDPQPTFDGQGDSVSAGIIRPTQFGSHKLGMATSPNDVQDAPGGPAAFSAPEALWQGGNLVVDLRALDVTYDGPPDSTCVSAAGNGCWLEGARQATGTYDPATGAFSLEWLSSQGFTGASAGVTFHLAGTFVGQAVATPPGTSLPGAQRYTVGDDSLASTSARSPSTARQEQAAAAGPPETAAPAAAPTALATSATGLNRRAASPALAVLRAAAAVLVVLVGAATLATSRA